MGGGVFFLAAALFCAAMLLALVGPRLAERFPRIASLWRPVAGEPEATRFVPHRSMMLMIAAATVLVAAAILIPLLRK